MIDQKAKFTRIFNKNLFKGQSSRSGQGSSLVQTEAIRDQLPVLLDTLNIESVLDAPCGDWNWMKEINLNGITYTGVDIVSQIIEDNLNNFAKPNIDFMCLNIITADLPKVDLIFCRDCLVHLAYVDIFKAIVNFKRSGSKYLLTTTFPSYMDKNIDLSQGSIWRALNLECSPFNFPKPKHYIAENSATPPFFGKALALWEIKDIQVPYENR